jgi:hypothetical protein
MAVFSINGAEAESLGEAIEICRAVWERHKAPAVLEQVKEALAKPSPIDIERARLGVVPRV